MCLIITKTIHGKPDWQAADRAARRNPDGYGIAWPGKGGRPSILKSLDWKPIRAKGLALQAENKPFILHMRFATHGAVNKSNCHPFRIDAHGLVMAHNGVITTLEVPQGMSDSRVLGKHLNESMPNGFLSSPEEINYVTQIAQSSRLSFMDVNGNLFFVNEDLGVWQDGVWYSQPYAVSRATDSDDVYNPNKWKKKSKPVLKSYDPEKWKADYKKQRAQKMFDYKYSGKGSGGDSNA